jgi:hypothetical protein
VKHSRRTILRSLASAPLAAGFVWTDAEAQQAHHQAKAAEAAAQKTATPFRPNAQAARPTLACRRSWTS